MTESADILQDQLDALEIPPNIDPRLLELYLQREHDEIERRRHKYVPPPAKIGRKLSLMFTAYIGIGVMCLSIILGLIQGKDAQDILQTTCIVFLIYAAAGFAAGVIAEHCVNDSVETLLREIVKRSREPRTLSADETNE